MAKLVDNPNLAFRLARAIVSDIALYNQEKVRDGIRNDFAVRPPQGRARTKGASISTGGFLRTSPIATTCTTGRSST